MKRQMSKVDEIDLAKTQQSVVNDFKALRNAIDEEGQVRAVQERSLQ